MANEKTSLRLAILAGLFASSSVAGDMTKLQLRPGVEFEGPAGSRLVQGAGTDSQIGTIVGPQFECSYDLGLYSNPLTDNANATTSETKLAGRAARLLEDGDSVDGLHVVQVEKSVLGNVNLTLFCKSETAKARQDVRAMFQTLSID